MLYKTKKVSMPVEFHGSAIGRAGLAAGFHGFRSSGSRTRS
ncbi:MAG: hypothetical protein ACRERS_05215 [Methylococcales bacterium]